MAAAGNDLIADQLVSFCDELRERGPRDRHGGDPRLVRGGRGTSHGAIATTSARRWRRRSRSRRRIASSSSWSSTAGSSAPPSSRRSSARAPTARTGDGNQNIGEAGEGGERIDVDELTRDDPAGDRRRRRGGDARPRPARRRRLRAPRRGLGRRRRRRPADPPLARAHPRVERAPTARPRTSSSTATASAASSRHLRRELERGLIERTGKLPPRARSPTSTGRCRRTRPRTSRRSTAR